MADVHKQDFRLRDLPTRAVTLFPNRAHVVRDIHDVALRPGRNQITVVGLSPTVDENSIQVEGTAAAAAAAGTIVVADIAVELLPNQDIFEDVYPDEDPDPESGDDDSVESDEEQLNDESDDDYDSDDDTLASPNDPVQLRAIRQELQQVRTRRTWLAAKLAAAREATRSANSRLTLLDAHAKAVLGAIGGPERESHRSSAPAPAPAAPAPPIDAILETYRAQRARGFEDYQAGIAAQHTLQEQSDAASRRENQLVRARHRATAPARQARRQARKARKRAALAARHRKKVAADEKRRVRQARMACWPRVCYTVCITLDVDGVDDHDHDHEEKTEKAGTPAPTVCHLTLSYHTAAASWSPSYDLQLATTAATGLLAFDALLRNHTSETWARCTVVLSTSQTTMAGIDDTAVPALVPWRVKLASSTGSTGSTGAAAAGDDARPDNNDGPAEESLLRSREERAHAERWRARASAGAAGGGGLPQRPRHELFGAGYTVNPPPPPRSAPAKQMACRKIPTRPMISAQLMVAANNGDDDDDDDDNVPSALAFQESTFEETGQTATYELPGLKTLVPTPPSSSLTSSRTPPPPPPGSKQRVARVAFDGVQFRHTVVAKYKPAAFLRATLRNRSRLTLLRGPVGVTLDGAFLGRSTWPRCGPAGDAVTLGLGIAPGLRVAYTGPAVRRTTAGLFGKEARTAYTRSVEITMGGGGGGGSTSTAASASATTTPAASPAAASPAALLVFDQIPVSEDEKLRVEVQQPRGLVVDGPSVATGVGSLAARNSVLPAADTNAEVDMDNEGKAAVTDWGSARATLKANGEVMWEVTLQPGRAVCLDLAYEVSVPAGEGVVQC